MMGGLQHFPGSSFVPFPQPQYQNLQHLPGQVLQSQVAGPVSQQHPQRQLQQPDQLDHHVVQQQQVDQGSLPNMMGKKQPSGKDDGSLQVRFKKEGNLWSIRNNNVE